MHSNEQNDYVAAEEKKNQKRKDYWNYFNFFFLISNMDRTVTWSINSDI